MEASSSVQQASALDTTYSNSDQMLLSIQSNLSFSSANICPNMPLSLPSLSGESRVADYQDCGVSPMFLGIESPWEPNVEGNCPQARKEAKIRYNEKKKNRTFGKQIRYISRKARADTRKRDKGRFVKACEPSEHTIH
ncbi:putative zinc finger protein CONSTANS-LIKE 11 [Asparagus officinalis]|nr:putative zinc finger protein CONSTANS-LIKE 11 [Asparagus officinalis]